MRVAPQPHRPADACNTVHSHSNKRLLHLDGIGQGPERQTGQVLRETAFSQSPIPHTEKKACLEKTVLSLAAPSWEHQGPWATVWFSRELSGNKTIALSTYRWRNWGKQQRITELKRNRSSPLPNSPHAQAPLSMKNRAKLPICKSLMKNKIKPKCQNCIWWQGQDVWQSPQNGSVCIAFHSEADCVALRVLPTTLVTGTHY